MRVLRLIADTKQSLKEFTENNYAQGAFFWNYLLKNKEIKVNGKRVSTDVTLCAGDEVSYFLTKKQEEKPAFSVVYEDKNLLVIDKESGVNSEAVFAALQRARECYFIHRLDRNTQGLMAFALNESTEKTLLQAFKERRVEKRYHALCVGTFAKKAEVLTAYLKKDADKSLVRVFDQPKSGAERIVTEYKTLCKTDGFTRVEVILHTGKTHQIRAHLAHVGHPILGDMKYGDAAVNKQYKAARQILVAKYLRFDLSGELAYLNGKEFVSHFQAGMPVGHLIGQTVRVVVDRPLGSYHPDHKDLYYSVNYGYIPGQIAPDGEEQDVYILGVSQAIENFEGEIIAVIRRENDVEEKWVVAPKGAKFTKEEIWEQVRFQEQYFRVEILMG